MSAIPPLSVVIAAHDEAPSIGEVVRRALAVCPAGTEVLVVDDGSTDDTSRTAEAAGARVLRLSVNHGKGAAMRAGIDAARGPVLAFLDGDGQDDPTELPMLLQALQPGVAMVIGSRFLGRFHDGAITGLNRFGNEALTSIINALFGCRLTDTQAGYRCVDRRALDSLPLHARRYDFETDVLLALLTRGERVVEVPVQRRARAHGRSGLSSVRDGLRIAGRIVMHRVTHSWRRPDDSVRRRPAR